jgi:hypothetical protein
MRPKRFSLWVLKGVAKGNLPFQLGGHLERVLFSTEKVVSRAGLEPATHWLKASCSTN